MVRCAQPKFRGYTTFDIADIIIADMWGPKDRYRIDFKGVISTHLY